MKRKFLYTTLFLVLISTASFSQKIVWRKKNPIPLETRVGSAVQVDNKIFYLGGTPNFDQVYKYDPLEDTWTAKEDMPFTIRTPYSLVNVDDTLYATSVDDTLSFHELYDPDNETWKSLTPQSPVRYHTRGAVVDGKIYIIGGNSSDNTLVYSKNGMYDPKTNTWEETTPMSMED